VSKVAVGSASAGSGYSCALLSTGVVKCWGSNTNGNVGDGTNVPRGRLP
jgi:alpha-tubulin suppressor-like RCC1 family protein